MRLKLYRGMWAVIGKDGHGRIWRRSLRTRDRAAAERAFADYRTRPTGNSISDAVELYLEEKAGKRSYQSMLTAWRALKPVFGHLRPDQVDRKLCRAYARSRSLAGVSDGTIIKDLGVLKAALRFAGKATGAVFDMPAAPPPRDRHINREELQRLIEACRLPHVRLFVALAWSTAGRHSSLLELTWDRIDLDRGTVNLARRGERGRKGRAAVTLTSWAIEALRAAHEARTSDCVVEWGGKPLKSIKRAFAEACSRAGLQDVTPHVLRHSAAVAMIEAGVPIEEISQFLGHTNIKVTMSVYARFSPDRFKRAAKALE
jgi:integrase